MKPASYEVAVFIIVVIISLLALISYSRSLRRTELRFHAAFHHLEKDHSLTINQKEVCHDSLIGYDENNRTVILLQKAPTGYSSRVFHLTQVKNCSVSFSYYSDSLVKLGENERLAENDISEIILQIEFNVECTPDISIRFYNEKINKPHEIPEIETRAFHWQHLIMYNRFRPFAVN